MLACLLASKLPAEHPPGSCDLPQLRTCATTWTCQRLYCRGTHHLGIGQLVLSPRSSPWGPRRAGICSSSCAVSTSEFPPPTPPTCKRVRWRRPGRGPDSDNFPMRWSVCPNLLQTSSFMEGQSCAPGKRIRVGPCLLSCQLPCMLVGLKQRTPQTDRGATPLLKPGP
jgi:hypothetical protein